jgi:hypothetical protein
MENIGWWSRLIILIDLAKIYKETETVQNSTMNTDFRNKI